MPTSPNTSTISTALDRARRHVSSTMNSLLGAYHQREDQTEATLNTMRGWLQADNINEEDVLFGIIGESVNQQIFPPTPHYVTGSAPLFAQYRNDIGEITADSLFYSLNPTNNHKVTGDPSQSRLETWNRLSEARRRQRSLIQPPGASMMHGMPRAGTIYAPQSKFMTISPLRPMRSSTVPSLKTPRS